MMSSNAAATDSKKKEDDPEEDVVLEASGWDKLEIPANVNYAITGHESQILTVKLLQGETVIGEPGSMMYLTDGITQHASYSGFWKRCCAGESCFVLNFTNSGSNNNTPAYGAMAPNFPTAKIVPIDLSSPHVNGKLITQQGAYMASFGEVDIGVSTDFNFMRCCCAGLGLVRAKMEGSGTVFLAGTGTIVQKVLQPGEVIIVDSNCVMAFADTCKLDIRRTASGVVGMAGSGEGIFNTTLTGPGLVIMQSMNELDFKAALAADKMLRR